MHLADLRKPGAPSARVYRITRGCCLANKRRKKRGRLLDAHHRGKQKGSNWAMPMKSKLPPSPGLVLRAALRSYNRGDKKPLEGAFALLRALLAVDEVRHNELLRSLVKWAVKKQDGWVLREVLALPGDVNFASEIMLAARFGWKEGYELLRQTHFDFPVEGMSLFLAFSMKDASAYYEPGTESFQAQVAKDFLEEVRARGLPNDDAIAFLDEVGLAWAIDFGIGLKDEWGRSRPPV